MSKSIIIKHYRKRIADFYAYFKKTAKRKRESDIHDLRVTIKKLRATWSLMDVVTQGSLNKEIHNQLFSKLFKQAGRVREAQVNILAIDKLNRKYLDEYKSDQRKLQKQAEKRLRIVMEHFNNDCFKILDKSWQRSVLKIPEAFIFEQSVQFINTELTKVQRLESELPNSKKLHKIRIILKAVHEIISILIQLRPSDYLSRLGKQIKGINHEIGQWHDTLVLLESFDRFDSSGMKKKDKAFLNKFIQRLSEKEILGQQRIHKKLKRFFTRQSTRVLRVTMAEPI